MPSFRALVLPAFDAGFFEKPILSQPVIHYICDALCAAGGKIFCAGSFCGLSPARLEGAFPSPGAAAAFFTGEAAVLVLTAPAPTLTASDFTALLRAAEAEPVCLKSGGALLAAAGRPQALAALLPGGLGALPALEIPGVPVVQNAAGALAAQEILRRRINRAHLENNVALVDPESCFIAPQAKLAPGCEILPGCMIYGATQVGAGCKIGPNCYLEDAVLGENITVNASQIYRSRLGAGTTVGPFAHIRPGCEIGERVRVGNFVELKNSRIGRGTKVSHLTYIGDSDFGEGVNVGCGVVTVNYDGKAKHRTVVGDGSFVGCNVNLVAPLEIGRDVYIAAGTTVTQPAPDESLVIARPPQTVKPLWVRRRRAEGRL